MNIVFETKYNDIHAWHRPSARCMYLHTHDFVEVLYARGGEWTVTLGFNKYKLNKGDIIFCFPGQVHGHEATNYDNVALLFPKNIPVYDGIWENYMIEEPVLHNVIDKETDDLFIKAAEANSMDSPYAKGIAYGYISLILGKLLPLFSIVPASKSKSFIEEKLIKFCSEHYKEQLTLTSVAEALNYTPSYVSHLFKNKIQITFYKLIVSMRIDEAKKELRGSKSITQIAFDCGFNSMRTFNKNFKAEVGITPREYRMKHKK